MGSPAGGTVQTKCTAQPLTVKMLHSLDWGNLIRLYFQPVQTLFFPSVQWEVGVTLAFTDIFKDVYFPEVKALFVACGVWALRVHQFDSLPPPRGVRDPWLPGAGDHRVLHGCGPQWIRHSGGHVSELGGYKVNSTCFELILLASEKKKSHIYPKI